MVNYKKLHNLEDGENILFEAPSHDIELNEIASNSENPSEDQNDLDQDDVFSQGFKHSDDRLISNMDEDDSIHRITQENAFSQSNQVGSSSSTTPQNISENNQLSTNSSRSKFSIGYISNNFNFLDRLFKNNNHIGESMDGVFSNLSAKPDLNQEIEADKPPTYEEAAADSTPPYWERSILDPGFGEEVFVDGLPVGNIINFTWNLVVSSSFQFVGFLLTYILHTSHAAKHGSRAGLGLTFISYGYSMIPMVKKFELNDEKITSSRIQTTDTDNYVIGTDNKIEGQLDNYESKLSSGFSPTSEESSSIFMVVLSFSVIAFGLFLIVKAALNYHRARKMEQVILQPPAVSASTVTEEV